MEIPFVIRLPDEIPDYFNIPEYDAENSILCAPIYQSIKIKEACPTRRNDKSGQACKFHSHIIFLS